MIELKYAYNSFEPYISSETMKNHYEKLYKGYVDNYNKTLKQLEELRNSDDYNHIKCLEKDLSFNGSGAVLHTLFFSNIVPYLVNVPPTIFGKINSDFGNFAAFKKQFITNITNIEGGGWGILGYLNDVDKLVILQCEKHQDLTIWGIEPLLIIDIWEHAYYLDYKTEKKTYAENIFNFIDWNEVDRRFKNNK